MKRIIILFCIFHCIDAKVNAVRAKHYKRFIPVAADLKSTTAYSDEAFKKHVRSSFVGLTKAGYGTRFKRWVTYLWRNKTEEERAQHELETAALRIEKEQKVNQFVERVLALHTQLSECAHRMEEDPSYNPEIVCHEDGSITIGQEKYSFLEAAFADDDKQVEKIESIMSDRLVSAAQDTVLKDPIRYFLEGSNCQEIIKTCKKELDMPAREVRKVLEGIFTTRDKKIMLKLHPDKNRDRVGEAKQAFENYNLLKDAYNNKQKEWEKSW